MEIGSFLELQLPKGREYYSSAIDIARLNTGRMAIWHAFRISGARRIWVPIYQCDSVRDTFISKRVKICYYHQLADFTPLDLYPEHDDAVLLVNYFGIMSSARIEELAKSYKNVIVDNCQAFFCRPVENALNVYSCRKFVGVPDGAYVIGKNAHLLTEEYQQGYSSDTAGFLLTRIEYGCEGKGYQARSINEHRIDSEDCMIMSPLTRYLLDGTDYDYIKCKRKDNFAYACSLFDGINKINPAQYVDDSTIPMVYPLVIEDDNLIERLQEAKHFQGHWWSYICDEQPKTTFEYWISRYVIPITIDQRYGTEELDYLHKIITNNNNCEN